MVDDELDRLVHGLRAGDDRCAAEVHARYVAGLVNLACARFREWGLTSADRDPEDVVQSVFRTFFRRCGEGQFRLSGWDTLWGLLAAITIRKCRARRDYLGAARRRPAATAPPEAAPDRQPGPPEAAVLVETLRDWLASLDPADRGIIELGLQGLPTSDIARRLARSERTVRRVRQHAEAALMDRVRAAPAPPEPRPLAGRP